MKSINDSGNSDNIALILLVPLSFAYFMSVLLGCANAIMSPVLIDEFSLSPADLGFMTSVYLVAFGLAQFPGGVFLDRCGARCTLAPAMLLGAAGTAVYALSGNMWQLVISRALVGAGMSCCLMGAFKAFAEWLPTSKLPVIYSVCSFIGGIGCVAATRPVAITIDFMGWRSCFWLLAALTALCALLIWLFIPSKENNAQPPAQESFATQLKQMCSFLKDSRFWFVAPIITAAECVLFAYQYLWICPWLRDVANMPEARMGMYMLYAGVGTAGGYLLNGITADFFQKRGWLSWEGLYMVSGAMMTILLAIITFDNSACSAWLWSIVMFFSAMTMVAFPIMRKLYPAEEVGRAFSLMNFLIFFISFIIQWVIGIVLNLYPVMDGHFSPDGHKLCLGFVATLNLAATVHFCYSWREHRKAGII